MTSEDATPVCEKTALLIAESHIAAMEPETGGIDLALMTNETIEMSFGWVFFYQSREWIESGDSAAMLAGNAPFLIERKSGRVVELGTAMPVDEYLKEYEVGLAINAGEKA